MRKSKAILQKWWGLILANPIIFLIVIALISRTLWVSMLVTSPGAGGDAEYYLAMARNLREFGVYGEGLSLGFYRPPLYSVFLWFTSFIPGDWRINTIIIQHLISVISGLICYKLLNRLQPRLSLLWAAAWLSSPYPAFSDTLILQESLYTNLIMIASALVVGGLPRFGFRQAFLLALLLSAAVWIRDAYLLLPFFFAVAVLWVTKFNAWKYVLLSLLVFTLTVAPWILRNANITGGGFFMSKGIAGMSLYVGTWQRNGIWQSEWLQGKNLPVWAFDHPEQREELENAMRVRDDGFLRAEAVRRLKDHPLEIAEIWISRSLSMWLGTRTDLVTVRFDRGGVPWTIFKAIMWGMNSVVLILGLIGLCLFGLRRSPLFVFSSVIGYVYIIYLPFLNIETRYSMSALPWLYYFCLLFIVAIIKIVIKNNNRDSHD